MAKAGVARQVVPLTVSERVNQLAKASASRHAIMLVNNHALTIANGRARPTVDRDALMDVRMAVLGVTHHVKEIALEIVPLDNVPVARHLVDVLPLARMIATGIV